MTQKTFDKALLVIDIQENLVNPGSKIHIDTTNIDQFFKNVNHTIDLFENSGLPVLYITNEWSNFLMNWITGNVCKKGGKGVGPDPRLKRVNMELYRKSTKSAFVNQQLLKVLRGWKVSEIFVVGLFAEHCVKATVTDALKKDFNVTVITDALGSKNGKKLRRSLEYYRRNGVTLVPADLINSDKTRMTA
ncbi:MAG TPA: isochorismatase family cysteine hydrolase [Puia sp.]|nr:isochorismatase family cysteine hydrolase [Puia sp.]